MSRRSIDCPECKKGVGAELNFELEAGGYIVVTRFTCRTCGYQWAEIYKWHNYEMD